MAEFQTGLEGLTLIPGRTGSFEVTLDDDVLYSKLSEDRFPEADEIKEALKAKL